MKYFFNVSTSYVLTKLRVLLFPFRQRTWTRLPHRSESSGQMEGYKSPRDDVNAPDLYIPSMSVITFVIVANIFVSSKSKTAYVILNFFFFYCCTKITLM
jgi:protein transport protein YIF1